MFQPTDIHEGMVVRGREGTVLGKVFAVGDDSFELEKGVFFPKEYRVDIDDVEDVRQGEIVLRYGRAGLHPADSLSDEEGANYEQSLTREPFSEEEQGHASGGPTSSPA